MRGRTPHPTIDLGLDLLLCVAQEGKGLTQDDIAAWCDCSQATIYALERQALRRLANRARFGDRETRALRDLLYA